MTVLADTSVWSRAYRADTPAGDTMVSALASFLGEGAVVTTGMIYLELLRGFTRPATRAVIEINFAAVALIEPTRRDYAGAAELSLTCREAGVQFGAVDALIAQVAIANDLTLLTTDRDFVHAARHIPLRLWRAV